MNSLGSLGRIIFGLAMAYGGVRLFLNASGEASKVPDMLPAPQVFVYLTGVALIAAAVSLIIGKRAQLAMILLGVLLILFALMVWLPATKSINESVASNAMMHLIETMALAGASWFFAAHLSD